ncbi:Tigger transposable element-derived protein 4-like [Oopsacas minuta]|uniref:Tigger transposable element-derived protein 4-like n=1 Tax=Oopsacas minuta TaxID=111878 RepID=A0AAV7K387_9METZ|nr:Tigger transposable element-derived protein 4-like [Oopsacas minuta]
MERFDCSIEWSEDWKSTILPTIMDDFTPENIFNAEETGLYSRSFPDKGYSIKGTDLPGGQKAKDRITVTLCANMSGTEKYPSLLLERDAWDAVEGNTIAECYQKGGFVPRDFIQSEGYEFNLDDDHMLDDVSLPSNMSLDEFENFITIDSEIPVSGDVSDVELLGIARKKIRVEDSESDGDDDDGGDNFRLSLEQMLQMVDDLRIFIQLNV